MGIIFALVLFMVSLVSGDTIPTSRPSISNQYSSSGYEGETMKYSCYLSSLGDPQVRWSWFCGQEQMRSHITYSTTYTYLTFRLSRKYHQKSCYCRATSPSSILDYNRTSSRSIIYVYHIPPTKPMIYAISPTTVRPGENIQVKCNLTSLGYPTISWRWFCDNQAPSYGTTIELETYLSLNVNNRSIGCRCRGTFSNSYYDHQYDEYSNLVQFLVFPIPDEPPVLTLLTPMDVSEGEDVSLLCSVPKLSNLDVSWAWYCGNHRLPSDRAEQSGAITKISFKAEMKYHQQFCYCRANQSLAHYVAYSNLKRITIITEVTTSCLSPVTFGSTTGLLLAIIVALFTVVVLQCVWLRKNNGTKETKSSKEVHQNPVYSNEPSYETLQRNETNM